MSVLLALPGARPARWLLASVLVAVSAAFAAAIAPAAPAQAAAKYVYLTFDDGPSTPYTSQIVSILTTYQARATFFETGQNVASYPSITRLVRQAGNSIQNHTWGHKDLRLLTWTYFKYQVSRTDAVISAQTGYTPRCLRPPGGRVDARVYSRAAALGKTVILWTLDPKDWSRPGTATIVSRVLNNVRPGSVILFHDGGGNRSQTVAALPTILKTLKARGYTVSREFWC